MQIHESRGGSTGLEQLAEKNDTEKEHFDIGGHLQGFLKEIHATELNGVGLVQYQGLWLSLQSDEHTINTKHIWLEWLAHRGRLGRCYCQNEARTVAK
jgi:hypothetical protein